MIQTIRRRGTSATQPRSPRKLRVHACYRRITFILIEARASSGGPDSSRSPRRSVSSSSGAHVQGLVVRNIHAGAQMLAAEPVQASTQGSANRLPDLLRLILTSLPTVRVTWNSGPTRPSCTMAHLEDGIRQRRDRAVKGEIGHTQTQ